MYEIVNGITVVGKGESPNYNRPVNQIKATKTEWNKDYYRKHKIAMNLPIQWFIYVRNYGVIRYKGTIYNLNLNEEKEEVYKRLEEDGIIGYEPIQLIDGTTIREPRMLLETYRYINEQKSRFFLINMVIHFFEELSEEEIDEYNRQHLPADWIESF